jgi:serine/threonine protein kinase
MHYNFLKSKGILHRDVKPSNILIKQNPVIFI